MVLRPAVQCFINGLEYRSSKLPHNTWTPRTPHHAGTRYQDTVGSYRYMPGVGRFRAGKNDYPLFSIKNQNMKRLSFWSAHFVRATGKSAHIMVICQQGYRTSMYYSTTVQQYSRHSFPGFRIWRRTPRLAPLLTTSLRRYVCTHTGTFSNLKFDFEKKKYIINVILLV